MRTTVAIIASLGMLYALAAGAAYAERRPGPLPPAGGGVSSDAHRSGPGGYGVYKSRRARQDYRDTTQNGGRNRPYEYRSYGDSDLTGEDRSPGACRQYADRAVSTRNRNWWTRYRACLSD